MKVESAAKSDTSATQNIHSATIHITLEIDDRYAGEIEIYMCSNGAYESTCTVDGSRYSVTYSTVMQRVLNKVSTSTIVTVVAGDQICTNFVNL